ncbi:UNVERIFIED_ORG: hypothetical protein M2348_000701 [Sphingomonas sp. R1F5B]
MPETESPSLVHLHGGIIYISTMLDSLMLALAANHVLPAPIIVSHMAAMKACWEHLAKDPDTPFPAALRNAQARLAASAGIFATSLQTIAEAEASARANPN